MQAVLDRDAQGHLIRKGGIMGVVMTPGTVRPGDAIRVEPPAGQPQPLKPV
jgi:MOSC domain-containing protein YiiM